MSPFIGLMYIVFHYVCRYFMSIVFDVLLMYRVPVTPFSPLDVMPVAQIQIKHFNTHTHTLCTTSSVWSALSTYTQNTQL